MSGDLRRPRISLIKKEITYFEDKVWLKLANRHPMSVSMIVTAYLEATANWESGMMK